MFVRPQCEAGADMMSETKLGVGRDANPFVEGQGARGKPSSTSPSTAKLKLGLLSYPVLQAADILVHRFVVLFLGPEWVGG